MDQIEHWLQKVYDNASYPDVVKMIIMMINYNKADDDNDVDADDFGPIGDDMK